MELAELKDQAESTGWRVELERHHTEMELQAAKAEDTEQRQERAELLRARARTSSSPGFLELFAGTARLALTIAALGLSWTEHWEIAEGPQYDVTDPHNLSRLFKLIALGAYWCIHMGSHSQ